VLLSRSRKEQHHLVEPEPKRDAAPAPTALALAPTASAPTMVLKMVMN
jgi:hypothetical protein